MKTEKTSLYLPSVKGTLTEINDELYFNDKKLSDIEDQNALFKGVSKEDCAKAWEMFLYDISDDIEEIE